LNPAGHSHTHSHRQRAELTFKHNVSLGRHGWLRLTPAYSVRVVDHILADHSTTERVVDPFSGTGTTPLCAAERGHEAVSFDINPFLVWLGNLKLKIFSTHELEEAQETGERVLESALAENEPVVPHPPLSNVERWWDRDDLEFLRRLAFATQSLSDIGENARDLVRVAFCRSMMGLSNAAFNHQSMSFKAPEDEPQGELFDSHWRERCTAQFRSDLRDVLAGADLALPVPHRAP
jgi:hypothetical protein